MTLIVDAGALYAQADRTDPAHDAVAEVLLAETDALVTSQLALAEADYLVMTRLGVGAELALIEDVVGGTFVAEGLSPADLAVALEVVARYRDLKVGLADASLVALAARHHTRRICTVDERCFRAMSPLQGGSFHLLPAETARRRPARHR